MSHTVGGRGRSESLSSTDAEVERINAQGDRDLPTGGTPGSQDLNLPRVTSPAAVAGPQASSSTQGHGALTGTVPKPRPLPCNDSAGTTDHQAPGVSGESADVVPSFQVLSIKDGIVDLFGKDMKFHRKYLNNLKTLVTRADKTFGRSLHDREVGVAELERFSAHVKELHRNLELIIQSIQYHGFHDLLLRGNIERYFDKLTDLYEECQLVIDGVDHYDTEDMTGDEANQVGDHKVSDFTQSDTGLEVQQELSQETQVGGDHISQRVVDEVNLMTGAPTGQASGTHPRALSENSRRGLPQVGSPLDKQPSQSAPQQKVFVQPNTSVPRVDPTLAPQMARTSAQASGQQVDPQLVRPGSQHPGKREFDRLLNPVLDLINNRNRQRAPLNTPQARPVNGGTHHHNGPAPAPQADVGPPMGNANNIPMARRPVVPQPMGYDYMDDGIRVVPGLDEFFRAAEDRFDQMFQERFQQTSGRNSSAVGQPTATDGGDLGRTNKGRHKKSHRKKSTSRHRRGPRDPSPSSSSSGSSDTSSSYYSGSSSSSSCSDGSFSDSSSDSPNGRRRKKKKSHRRHSSRHRRAKLGQLTKFDGKQPELFRYFKSSYDYQIKQEKLSSMDKCVKLFDLLEGEARELVVYYAEKFDKHSHRNMWKVLEERYGGTYRSQRRAFQFLDEMKPFKQFTHKEQHDLLTKMRVVMDYIKKKQRRASKEKSFPTFITIRKLVPTKSMFEYTNWIYSNTRRDNIHSFFKWLQVKWKCTLELEEDKQPITSRHPPKNISNRDNKPKQFLAQDSEALSESEKLLDETELSEQSDHSVDSNGEIFVAGNQPGFRPKYKGRGNSSRQKTFAKKPFTPRYSANKQKVDQLSTAKCEFCKTERHSLATCEKFLKASPLVKVNHMKSHKLCWHCLRSGHFINKCRVNVGKVCGVEGCQRRHHPAVHTPVNKSKNLYVEDLLEESFSSEADNDVDSNVQESSQD